MFKFKIGTHLVEIPLESVKLPIVSKDNKELYQNIYVNLTDDNLEDNDDELTEELCFEGIYLYKAEEMSKFIYGVNSHKLEEIFKKIPGIRKRFKINTEMDTMCRRYNQDIDKIMPKIPIKDDCFKNLDVSIKEKSLLDILIEENTPSSQSSNNNSQDSYSDSFQFNKNKNKSHYAARIIPITILAILFQEIKTEEKSLILNFFHFGSFHRFYYKYQENCLECRNTDDKFLPQIRIMIYNVLKMSQIIEYRCSALQKKYDKITKKRKLEDNKSTKKRKFEDNDEPSRKKRKIEESYKRVVHIPPKTKKIQRK